MTNLEEKNGLHPTIDTDEWLTIAEAARRLGLDPTQVRRDSRRLDSKDRTGQDTSPMRLSLSALIALREEKTKDRTKTGTGQDKRQDTEETVPSEVDFLREQLREKDRQIAAHQQAEAELRRLMLTDKAELAELRQKAALPPVQEAYPERRRSWWGWWRRREGR